MFLLNKAKTLLTGDDSSTVIVIVSWLGNRFNYEVAKEKYEDTTVGDLRIACAEETGLEPDRIRLILLGQQLKDDGARLKQLGIKHNSLVMMSGSKGAVKEVMQRGNEEESPESRCKKRVDQILAYTQEHVEPLIKAFDEQVSLAFSNEAEMSKEKLMKFTDDHIKCTELLMMQIMQMDAVQIPEGNEDCRQLRKSGVKKLHDMLEECDKVMEKLPEELE